MQEPFPHSLERHEAERLIEALGGGLDVGTDSDAALPITPFERGSEHMQELSLAETLALDPAIDAQARQPQHRQWVAGETKAQVGESRPFDRGVAAAWRQ